MLVSDFDYELPPDLIAQEPLPERDKSRLLILERHTGRIHDTVFADIVNWLGPKDLLVLNNTKVIPARIYGKLETGRSVEFLLLRCQGSGVWSALVRPARKARPGTKVQFRDYEATILTVLPDGIRLVSFEPADVGPLLEEQGEMPLPPYIKKKCDEPERYQTVYAELPGAVAAPTAGLHFTPEILKVLQDKGVELATVTLHVGAGSFRPVKTLNAEEHKLQAEQFQVTDRTAEQVNRALAEGRRIVCCGTTTVRVLESRARLRPGVASTWQVEAGQGETDLYILPGYQWKVTGALLTNFHLPRSTLLMLVCAFAGRETVLRAYAHAVSERYRFYSFGDAMLIV